ncbi:WD40-repeat-containing domain protein [Chlamydoabsidia padenii]|nr:WD40-repeat-containing domain protein [Chlamydoabsidia padenii]
MEETDQGDSLDGTTRSQRYPSEEESDEEYDFGECFKSLHGHEGNILCVDFDHPKGTLVSSSLDDTIRVWDLRQERCYGQLEGHSNLVRCLQLDDMRLLTGSDDGTVKQWDLSNVSYPPDTGDVPILDNACVASFDGHQREITAMHADFSHLVSGSNDKTMKLWDLATQDCVLTMDVMWASQHSTSHSWSFDNLKMNFFEPSNDYIGALQFWNFALASGTMDGKLRMWDLRTGQVHRTLPGHKGAITALQFDEIHLVSGSADKTVRVWDLRTGSVSDTLSFTDPVSSLQFSSGKIISTTNTTDIDVYNRTSFQHSKLSGHAGSVNALKYKNHVLASGSNDKIVKLWAM